MFGLLKNRMGMTLVEVVTAVLILGIVVAPLASFFIISNNRARRTVNERRALSLAEAHMEWLRQEQFAPVFVVEEEEQEMPPLIEGRYQIFTEIEELNVTIGGEAQIIYKVIVRVKWPEGEVHLSTISSQYR